MLVVAVGAVVGTAYIEVSRKMRIFACFSGRLIDNLVAGEGLRSLGHSSDSVEVGNVYTRTGAMGICQSI